MKFYHKNLICIKPLQKDRPLENSVIRDDYWADVSTPKKLAVN